MRRTHTALVPRQRQRFIEMVKEGGEHLSDAVCTNGRGIICQSCCAIDIIVLGNMAQTDPPIVFLFLQKVLTEILDYGRQLQVWDKRGKCCFLAVPSSECVSLVPWNQH
jgi:hypothetical protein